MDNKEANKAIKEGSQVGVGPTNLLDLAGGVHHFVLTSTGRLVAKRKQGKETIYRFETNTREVVEGPASMFRPYPG